jgi:MFS family permease
VRQRGDQPVIKNRWWIVAASVIGLVVGQGAVELYCFGVFLKPLSDGIGLTRGTLSSGLLTASVFTALATPIVGWLIDRYGSRAVMLPGIAAFALAMAARSTLHPSSLALVYVLFVLSGIFGAVQTPIIYAAIVCKWFDRERGLALGLAMAGTGLGVVIVPQTMDFVIQASGWRTAYLFLGTMIFACAFLPVALFVREPSVSDRAQPGTLASVPGSTIAEAVTQSWRFWSLGLAFLIGGICIFGTLVHAVAILTDRGISSQAAAAALSAAGLAMIVGRVASGYCLDRFHGPCIAITSFVVPMAGIALLSSGIAGPAPFVGILLCGVGTGAQIGLQPFFASRYFGLKSIGAISGAMFSLFLIGTGVGPYISGACFDIWHSYVPALVSYVVALGVASLLFAPLGPYPFAAALGQQDSQGGARGAADIRKTVTPSLQET